MAGENPLESRSGAPDEFMSHPRWQRFVIAIAGPAMNIILAIGLLTGVFMVHYEHPVYLDQPAVVGWVLENSPAAKAGIEQGDRIVRIDGVAESDLGRRAAEGDDQLQAADRRRHPARQLRSWKSRSSPSRRASDHYGTVGWLPDETVTVTELEPDMPAAKAGHASWAMRSSPSTAPRCVRSFLVIHYLQQNGDKPVDVTADPQRSAVQLQVTPTQVSESGAEGLSPGLPLASRCTSTSCPSPRRCSRSVEREQEVLAADRGPGAAR